MKTKFYKFNQINSGGSFDVDENVCHRVIIEAENKEQAISKFEPMIVSQSGSCDCCGERWSLYPDELNLESINKSYNKDFGLIENYIQYLADEYGWTKPDARIFYIDGTKKEIFSTKRGI